MKWVFSVKVDQPVRGGARVGLGKPCHKENKGKRHLSKAKQHEIVMHKCKPLSMPLAKRCDKFLKMLKKF
jgi:hypothetical protein